MVVTESQARLVHQETQDLPDRRESGETEVNQDHEVSMERLAHKVHRENQVKMETLDSLELVAFQDQQDHQETPYDRVRLREVCRDEGVVTGKPRNSRPARFVWSTRRERREGRKRRCW